ncbi:flavoprotein [Streptomyces sp. NPDC008159]|uniref:flavoprotein n=1 Tax=Streptomyces sp. NPDC008159 TaxID=3364817 RepID=UPI0036E3F31E
MGDTPAAPAADPTAAPSADTPAAPTPAAPPKAAPPPFTGRRLLLIASGAVNAVHLPYWLTWMRSKYPDTEVQVVATRSAQRFVTLQALSALTGRQAIGDTWTDDPLPTALHVELAEWADSVAVYPASLHYMARAALGLGDSPSLLALHGTAAPIVLAPSLPPRVEDNPAYVRHLKALAERPNLSVAPTRPGVSMTTGRRDGRTTPPLPDVLAELERLRDALPKNPAEEIEEISGSDIDSLR